MITAGPLISTVFKYILNACTRHRKGNNLLIYIDSGCGGLGPDY